MSKVTLGSVSTSTVSPVELVADPVMLTAAEKSVSPPPFSMMNSADCPSVIQLGVAGLTEQSGNAWTDEQGEPRYEVQLTVAPVVRSCMKAHP